MASAEEIWVDDSLLVFDGRVLEVFGASGSESIRFHVDNLRIEIGEPFRAGRRRVQLRPRTRGSGGCALEVEESDWATVEPLLTRVVNAGTPPPARASER